MLLPAITSSQTQILEVLSALAWHPSRALNPARNYRYTRTESTSGRHRTPPITTLFLIKHTFSMAPFCPPARPPYHTTCKSWAKKMLKWLRRAKKKFLRPFPFYFIALFYLSCTYFWCFSTFPLPLTNVLGIQEWCRNEFQKISFG